MQDAEEKAVIKRVPFTINPDTLQNVRDVSYVLSEKYFYPRDAMLARVIAIATCLSVCPSVRHAPVLCQNEES